MAKKTGVLTKVPARVRRSIAESVRQAQEAREKEDEYWREPKSKATKKREEATEKRAEAAARKAEARRLAELEERELQKSVEKKKKVTEAELWRGREEEEAKKAEEAKKRMRRTVGAREYESMVLVENRNREVLMVDASSLDEAIAQMAVLDHPDQRRVKAAFKGFEEAQLGRLKETKPGLAYTQYQDMLWKLWKKSQDNPLNTNPTY